VKENLRILLDHGILALAMSGMHFTRNLKRFAFIHREIRASLAISPRMNGSRVDDPTRNKTTK
jgi:hypothetical protein